MHDYALARFRCVRPWAEHRATEILSPSCCPQRSQAPTPASWSHTTGTVPRAKAGVMGVGGRRSGRASGQEGSLDCLGKNKYESLYSKGSKKGKSWKKATGAWTPIQFLNFRWNLYGSKHLLPSSWSSCILLTFPLSAQEYLRSGGRSQGPPL